MTRYVTSVLLLVGLCGSALAQGPHNVIYQHNSFYNDPNSPGYPFFDVEQDRLIYINHGVEGQVFEFEAVLENNGQYVGPGDINLVTADDNAGTVELTFVGHNGHPYGAANIKEVWLLAANRRVPSVRTRSASERDWPGRSLALRVLIGEGASRRARSVGSEC